MSAAVERLDIGRFSLEAHAGRSEGLGLFASGGLLTPLQPEDFRSLLGDEAERSVRESARALADLAASVPGGRDAHYQLARALRLLGDDEGARHAVRRALEIDPGFTPALALEAELEGRPFPPPEAASSESAVPPEADWKGPWLTTRASGGRRPRPAERLEAHDRLAAFARRRGDPYIGFSLEVFLGRGAARLRAEDFEGAEEDFAVARHLAPGSLEPPLLLAKTYFLAGRPEEARRTLDRLYADRGEEASAALWIAAVCIAAREHRDSLAWIERLGEGALKDRLRAVALAHLERWSDAREAAGRAVERVPEDLRANALLVWSLTHELRSREGEEGEVAGAIAVRLLDASERAVERAPEHGHLRFLRNVALVTVRRHLTRLATLERRRSMNARKASLQNLHGLQDIVSPALLAMVLAAGVPLEAREVFDDFAADPDPWDGDPVAWDTMACCPGDAPPGGCEGIEGLALLNAIPGSVYGIGTVEPFSGDVRVHQRISFCGVTGDAAFHASLHVEPFQVNLYLGGIRHEDGQWWFVISKFVSGKRVRREQSPAGPGYENGVYELEFQSIGPDLELRVWPEGSERPEEPQFVVQDPDFRDFRSGSAGISYRSFAGTERGVISSIRITELAPYFRRGDTNVDGVVDLSDALHIARGEVFPCEDAADGDDGGTAERGDAGDASAVLDYLFRGGSLPPPGADVPGPDPTEDALACDAYAPSAQAKLAQVRLELTGFPAEVEGRPGETIALDGFAAITVSGNTTSQGPVGWSFGITGQNASVRIGDVQAAATDAAAIFQGGFAFPDDGSGGAAVCIASPGAVSAMADLSGEGAALPAEGTFTVAPLRVEIPVPDEEGTAVLRFTAGCRGAGSPVGNLVRNTVSFDAEPDGSHRIVSQAPSLVSWTIQVRIRPAGGRQLPGDANQDGKLDLSDAVWLLGHLFLGTFAALPCEGGTASSPGPGELALLDSNGDGRIDLSDAVRVLGFLFGGSAPPILGVECVPIPGCPEVPEGCGQQ
ncbi:MAG: tetratricopeptide repeat protein [Planctomycetes bacterium]|nr:tetratricopeptide repeat protein [Planctomycetota bacterium]